MKANWLTGFLVLVVALCTMGCESEKEKAEKKRVENFDQMRQKLRGTFMFAALAFVVASFAGPMLAEGARSIALKRLRLSTAMQVRLAKAAYWSVLAVVAILSVASSHLRAVFPAVLLLLAATLPAFYLHVLPSLSASQALVAPEEILRNRLQRKAGLSQVKSFLLLIFVFYVVLRSLSPAGFGSIQLHLKDDESQNHKSPHRRIR